MTEPLLYIQTLLGHHPEGLPEHLLETFGGLYGLSVASVEALCSVRGMTVKRANRLSAAFALSRQLPALETAPTTVHQPEEAVELLRPYFDQPERESLVALYLNGAHRPLGIRRLSIGSDQYTTVCPRLILRHALILHARSIVLAHNHPSGEPHPSVHDEEVTRRVSKACQTLGITLIDHLLINRYGWTSMAQLNRGNPLRPPSSRWLH